jgi:hypothetical protein
MDLLVAGKGFLHRGAVAGEGVRVEGHLAMARLHRVAQVPVSGGQPEIVKKITKPACRPETLIPVFTHRREFPSALLFL